MSVLSHQSDINPIQNFWGSGGGVPEPLEHPPFIVDVPSTMQDFDAVVSNETYFTILNTSFYKLPYDVLYMITGVFNFQDMDESTPEFDVGVSGTTIVAFSKCNFTATKGWFGMSVVAVSPVPAGVDGEEVSLIIQNLSGSDIAFKGNANWTVIGYPY